MLAAGLGRELTLSCLALTRGELVPIKKINWGHLDLV